MWRETSGMVRTPTKILLVCLLILMWFPMAEMNLCIFKEYEYSENRELAKEPELKAELSALRRFPKDCESFIGDHLGFRCSLIRLNNILRVNLLGVSPVPSVVMGRDSWLFYRSEVFPDGFTFNDHCGLIPLSETELDALRERIEWNHELFSRNGIFYIVVIVPNKNTIYGEFLPESIVRNGNPTRLEQFSEYMRNHSRVKVMDLRRALLNAKKTSSDLLQDGFSLERFRRLYRLPRDYRRTVEGFPGRPPHIDRERKGLGAQDFSGRRPGANAAHG